MRLHRRFSRSPSDRLMGVKLGRKGRGRRLLKAALWVFGLVALFAVLGFFVVPPVAKHYLVKNLSELLNRQVAIESIQVNPFAMTVAVRGVSIKEPGSSEVFVSFEELFVNLQAESILRRAPILEEIRLQRPYAHIARREDGSYNFSDLLKKFTPDPSTRQPPKEKQEDARFSLNNIQIVAGKVLFEDRPKHAEHAVTDINLSIPFISNLPYDAGRYVQPSFSAKVNDASFAVNGKTKPFENTLETQVELNIYELDIPRYVEYIPVKLGFKIPSGRLDTRIIATFVRYQDKAPALILAGKIALEKFAMTQLDGRALASLARLEVPVESATVFARDIKLGNILLQNPELFVRRERDGTLNWMSIVPKHSPAPEDSQAAKDAPEANISKTAKNSEAPAHADAPAGSGDGAKPLKLAVSEVKIEQGQIHLADEGGPKPFTTEVQGLQVLLQKFALPQTEPAMLEVGFNTKFGESVRHAGTLFVSPLDVEGSIEVTGVKPRNYAGYFSHLTLFDIEEGTLNLSTRFHAAQAGEKLSAAVSGLDASISKLRLRKRGAKEDFLTLPIVALKGVTVDLDKRTAQVAELSSKDARLHLVRDKDGTVDLTRLTPPAEQNPAPAAGDRNPARPLSPAAPAAPAPSQQDVTWQWQVKRIALERYAVTFDDQVPSPPVMHVVDPIKLSVENLSNRRDSSAKIALDLGINKTGKVAVAGPLSINPPGADLSIDVQALDLVPLQPYFGEKLNILVTSGEALLHGLLGVKSQDAGPVAVAFKGDAGVNNFASVDKAKSEDFLKWKSLYVGGIDTITRPFALQIQEVALSDFYSRLIIYPTGQLNVQDIVAKDGVEKPADENGSTEAKTDTEKKTPAAAEKDKPPQAPAPSAPPEQAQAMLPPITIGKVTLQGGDVNFSDFFIKPNYSADLSDIGGSITGLSSELNTTADVDLRGRFAKTAPVEIKGKVNPLVQNLYLDIKANVRDIELGPFTPYSAKYVGYGIEKGKMSFNVEYKIENRKLASKNRLTLDQLTFGEKIESTTATKLPVLLAVSLLKDRNGVIDVTLPISGSLDDPKFSVGGIVLQIIFNLIEKAVTAPFALIGSMFGEGGEELAYVEFEPGRSELTAESQEKLGKLQTALIERPGLKLDAAGRADPDKDREGLRRYRFDQQVKAQKLKDLVKKGSSVASTDEVKIDPKEYEIYLRRAYKEAKFPKPRNRIGIPKDLPKEEMEKLMLTSIPISDDDLILLANQRSQAAKDFITRGDQVPVERVFLLAPKLEAPKGDGKLAAGRVDFTLK